MTFTGYLWPTDKMIKERYTLDDKFCKIAAFDLL